MEIKNKLTVTRGEVGVDKGGEGGRVFRHIYKGHKNKTKQGQHQGWEVGMAGVGGEWWGENGDNCT